METKDIQECCNTNCGVLYSCVIAKKEKYDKTRATRHDFDYSICPVCKGRNDKQ